MPDLLTDDGVRLHYTVQGDGPESIVCLHWLGGCTANWNSLGARLDVNRQRLIALDLRGHGRSETQPCVVTNERLVWDVLQLADALHLARFAIIGHSFGGKLALQVAAAAPRRVAALALLGSLGPGLVPLDRAAAEPLLQNSTDAGFLRTALGPWMHNWEHPDLLAAMEQLRQTPAWVLRAILEAALWTDVSAAVTGLTMPGLIISGDSDPVYGPAYQELAVQPFLPHANQAVLKDCGHGLHLEQPDQAAALIARFFRSVAA